MEETQFEVKGLDERQIERMKERQEYLKKHAGHEEMHAEMLLIILFCLLAFQVILLVWKKFNPRSFQNATLLGFWFIPTAFSAYYGFWRFIFVWSIFSVLNSFVIYHASRQPLKQGTPRLVYKWYFVVFQTCYTLGAASMTFILMDLLGLVKIFTDSLWLSEVAILICYYALYFGVLGRDFADMCSSQMASTLGFYSQDGMPSRIPSQKDCGVCANPLLMSVSKDESKGFEKTINLPCHHTFHEWCIKGWCLIGKKDVCPCCKEKVDLSALSKNPWDQVNIKYGSFLDGLRYLLVWHPIIIGTSRVIIHLMKLE